MKKRAMSRTKHSKKNLVDKKTLFIIGASLFVVFAFLLMFVANNPQLSNSTQVTGGAVITGQETFIANMFSGWTEGNLDTQLAKILLWVTLLMFITSVLNFAGFPPQKFFQFMLGLIVSFLAVAYITPNEIVTMLASYSALGLTLGTLVPFIIIMFTSAMLLSNEGGQGLKSMTIGKVLLQIVLWAMWGSFLLYRLITLWVTQGFNYILTGGGLVLAATALISIVILIFNAKFRKFIWGIGNSLREAKEEAMATSEAAHEKSRHKIESARDFKYEGA